MSSINIREELDRFRDRLLDLSNSNRLLNYRKTKTRSVQIVHASLDHIMQRLVQKAKPFRFQWAEEAELRRERGRRANQQRDLPFPSLDGSEETRDDNMADDSGEALLPAEEDEYRLMDLPEEETPVPVKQRNDTLQTDRTEAGLERVLTTLRRAAKNAIEETGVNYLYIALGMLDWNESSGATRRLLSSLVNWAVIRSVQRFCVHSINCLGFGLLSLIAVSHFSATAVNVFSTSSGVCAVLSRSSSAARIASSMNASQAVTVRIKADRLNTSSFSGGLPLADLSWASWCSSKA